MVVVVVVGCWLGCVCGLCSWWWWVVPSHYYGRLLLAVAVVLVFFFFFFCWLSLGFFCCWICEFVEFWLFLYVILVGFWDDFVVNLMDLGCVNGGLWTVEVAGVLGLLIVLQNLQMIGLWCFFFLVVGCIILL